jgi:multimeric flavodoxin WrbA
MHPLDSMKIAFVNGSPRPDGNTGSLMKALARRARDRRAEVAYFELADDKVQDRGKDGSTTGAYSLIQSSDMLIVGSPIYMGAETELTRCFMDHLRRLMTNKRCAHGKRAAALFTCGLMDGRMVYGYMHDRYQELIRHDLGFEEVMTFIVPGMKNRVDLEGNHYAQETLDEMERYLFPE